MRLGKSYARSICGHHDEHWMTTIRRVVTDWDRIAGDLVLYHVLDDSTRVLNSDESKLSGANTLVTANFEDSRIQMPTENPRDID